MMFSSLFKKSSTKTKDVKAAAAAAAAVELKATAIMPTAPATPTRAEEQDGEEVSCVEDHHVPSNMCLFHRSKVCIQAMEDMHHNDVHSMREKDLAIILSSSC